MAKHKKIAFVCNNQIDADLVTHQLSSKGVSNIDVFIDGCDEKNYDIIKFDVRPNIEKVLIIDLTGVHEKVNHLPDSNFNFNKVKKKRGESDDAAEDKSIEDVVLSCESCKQVARMIDCKRNTVLSDELSVTTYFCPNCGAVIHESSIDLSTNEVEKIKTSTDIDFKKTYTNKEVMQVLGELIKNNTNAKPSWGHFIHKQCMRNDAKRYREAFYGYAQGVFGSAKSWRTIMDIYDS